MFSTKPSVNSIWAGLSTGRQIVAYSTSAPWSIHLLAVTDGLSLGLCHHLTEGILLPSQRCFSHSVCPRHPSRFPELDQELDQGLLAKTLCTLTPGRRTTSSSSSKVGFGILLEQNPPRRRHHRQEHQLGVRRGREVSHVHPLSRFIADLRQNHNSPQGTRLRESIKV